MVRSFVLAIATLLNTGTVAQERALLVSLGNAENGKAVYAQCLGCHSPDRHRTGPKHCGLIGRVSGTAYGYQYSKAMQEAEVIWSEQTLDYFLAAPLDFIPGINMGIAGIRDEMNRRDLIAYLIVMNKEAVCD